MFKMFKIFKILYIINVSSTFFEAINVITYIFLDIETYLCVSTFVNDKNNKFFKQYQ